MKILSYRRGGRFASSCLGTKWGLISITAAMLAGCGPVSDPDVRVVNQQPDQMLAAGYARAIERAFGEPASRVPVDMECRVHVVDVLQDSAGREAPGPARIYFVVTGVGGELLGGDDCRPSQTLGRCAPWIAKRAGEMCRDAAQDKLKNAPRPR